MPYSITEDAADCDGFAVVKDSDGEVMGCHETEDDAQEQIAALEASESKSMPATEQTHRSFVTDAEIRMASDNERTTVQVMTEDIARDGMVIRADGVDTSSYMDNPVVLWNHGMTHDLPVARTVDMQQVDGGLRATVEWDDDEFSQEIKRKVKSGMLNAVSIGWRTEDAEEQEVDGRTVPVVTRADMTEFSFVSVPADANALVLERSAADAVDDINALYTDLDAMDIDDVPILRAIRELIQTEIKRLEERLTDDQHRASATAETAPDATEDDATADASAAQEPVDAPVSADRTPEQTEPREATPEDYERLIGQLIPHINTHVKRQLGKA